MKNQGCVTCVLHILYKYRICLPSLCLDLNYELPAGSQKTHVRVGFALQVAALMLISIQVILTYCLSQIILPKLHRRLTGMISGIYPLSFLKTLQYVLLKNELICQKYHSPEICNFF
jgi:hypothetical protein